jgi:hypothetical protein
MTRKNLICLAGTAMVLGWAICAAGDSQPAQQKIRIGVFNTRAVALAYGRSKMFSVDKLISEAKEARAKGNEKKSQKLEAQLKMLQDKVHWQVFYDGNIDDILAYVQPHYADIAKKAGVCIITEQAAYSDKDVEIVDVTTLMAEQFAPDEKTQKIMNDLMKHPPMSFEQMKKAEAAGTL